MTDDDILKCVALLTSATLSQGFTGQGLDDVTELAESYYQWLKYTRIGEDK